MSYKGLEAHGLNTRTVTVMVKHGVDIREQRSDVVDDAMLDAADMIVTVCSHDEHCPVVPVTKLMRHLPFVDPAEAP